MIPEDKLRVFFENRNVQTYKKGACVLSSLDNPKGMYYVAKGYVRQQTIVSSGETLFIHVYKPGSCFPLMWLFNETPNRYTYEAMTATVIKQVPADQFREFLAKHQDILEFFMRKVLVGLDGMLSRMESLVLDDAFTKTVLLFLYYAKSFGTAHGKGVTIAVPLSHKHIAAWIGTARETASLQVVDLQKKGLVKKEHGLYILPSVEALYRVIQTSEFTRR